MKRIARILGALALFWGLATLLSAALGGWLVPPVVMEAHNTQWSLENSTYPQGTEIFECEAENGTVLRGLLVPSDGRGLVVHFAEAGNSVTSSLASREQYAQYAELGFASLAIDYSGVGLSGGSLSPSRFDEDVRAIYRSALQLVDGDPSRLLLRGCSLGTVAVSLLLQEGARPAGAVLIAPVESASVATRFGCAHFWDLPVILASPHLKRFSAANTLEAIESCEVPVLAIVHPEDFLLQPADWKRLRRLEEKENFRLFIPELDSSGRFAPAALRGHILLSQLSFSTEVPEIRFVTGLVPGTPPVEQRLTRVLNDGSAQLVELAQSKTPSPEALRTLVGLHQHLDPDVALAAGLSLSAEEVLQGNGWIGKFDPGGLPIPIDPTPEQLLRLFDLEDPTGKLDIRAVLEADFMTLILQLELEASESWTSDHVLGLASCLFGQAGHPLVRNGIPEEDLSPAGPVFWLSEGGTVRFLGSRQDARFQGTVNPQRLYEILDVTAANLDPEDERRILRCLLKAHGFWDRVERSEAGIWSLLPGES